MPFTAPTTVGELREWEFRRAGDDQWSTVRLPHDAMIREPRDPASPGGADLGWFPGGAYEYRTTWHADKASGHSMSLRFEGVQGNAVVTVNGARIGEVRSGYAETELPVTAEVLAADGLNEVRVDVDNTAQPASRWYSGSGLFRPVRAVSRPPVHFVHDGLRLTTRSLTAALAIAEVSYALEPRDAAGAEVTIALLDGPTLLAERTLSGGFGVTSLDIPAPRPWSAESPHLYELVATATVGGEVVDIRRERVGLRTIDVDAARGFRLNGSVVTFRGACIHHDHGVLGAAGHRAAEFRRIRRLKEAGFNAVRSAHHPMSRDLLDACDEIGMYVLDEFADYWVVSKTKHDGAPRFRATWRADADLLIAKDRNRPSVVMYAIGNEIPETATPHGIQLAREITHHFHAADPDRPVTAAVNLFLNAMVALDKSPYSETAAEAETSMAGSTEANVMINHIGRLMNVVSRLPVADRASREVFSVVDVAGYNYGMGRYERDVKKYPHRVILGSETLPGDIVRGWELVQRHPSIIGDFVWVGWEFLGEAGVGSWVPGKRAGLSKPYPHILHGGGLFDLTGRPDASLRLAQAAWGTLTAPAIAVRPMDRSGVPTVRSAWRSTDAVESWSWRGTDGRRAEIEVYTTDDEVELLLNGRSIGRRKAGRRRGYIARFRVPYEPGVLTAIGYRRGAETGRSELRSARGPLSVQLTTDSEELLGDGRDLAYVDIALADTSGIVEMLAEETVTVTVSGPAELAGLGTAAPAPTTPFTSDRTPTFRGRALAVLRSTGGEGTVTVTVSAPHAGTAQLQLAAVPPARDSSTDVPRTAPRRSSSRR
ncbi:glycoside hydrolase family 2 protein [Brachybacterium massiliense]|uniref:glycoside hydrolase family 2 protein n=1 Tax=Brachybacterium massiliense TaxID=1755098 RepID=UPI000B3BC737|nr:glycoside hydrolase family 2 TIM barrel-domain containing protein [Brachybacterium massiliense]